MKGEPVNRMVNGPAPAKPKAPVQDAKTPDQKAARKQYAADAAAEAKLRKKKRGGRGGAPSHW